VNRFSENDPEFALGTHDVEFYPRGGELVAPRRHLCLQTLGVTFVLARKDDSYRCAIRLDAAYKDKSHGSRNAVLAKSQRRVQRTRVAISCGPARLGRETGNRA